MQRMYQKQATYLFESVRKQKYTDHGVRKMLAQYAKAAGITRSVSPYKMNSFCCFCHLHPLLLCV
jgi:integrase/recombinase XerD